MKKYMLCLLLVLIVTGMVSGCAKVPRSRRPAAEPSALPLAAKNSVPVAAFELAPLAPEVAALNDDLYRVANAVRAMKGRVDTLSTALASPEGAADAQAELRGQREALLDAASGLRDAKARVDILQAGLPAYEAELTRLRQDVVRVEREQAAALLAVDDGLDLRKELERAQRQSERDQSIAVEHEKQIRELRDALEASRRVRSTQEPKAGVSP